MRLARGGLMGCLPYPPADTLPTTLGRSNYAERARVTRVPPGRTPSGLGTGEIQLSHGISPLVSDAAAPVRALGTMTTAGPTDH